MEKKTNSRAKKPTNKLDQNITTDEVIETTAQIETENAVAETAATESKVGTELNSTEANIAETVAEKNDLTSAVSSVKADETGSQAEGQKGETAHAVRTISPGMMILKRFFRSKLSIIGLCILLFLFAFSFFGPLFVRWGEVEQDDSGSATSYLQYPINYTGADGEQYTVYDVSYDKGIVNSKAGPSTSHLLGTDQDGRDILTRIMYGGRISLLIGIIVVFTETILGVFLGSLAGFFGKWIDQVIMRVVDIFNCVPTLPILFLASALLDGWKVPNQYRIYYLMIILTIFGWSGVARMVRGQILSLREQEFMIAGESLGLTSARRIFRHLIPNILPQLIVSMTLGLGGIILYESTLSFLGLGVPLPYAAWGTMISIIDKDPDILSNYWHIWVPPGLCIISAVLGFNFVGDGLRDAFDPKMKR